MEIKRDVPSKSNTKLSVISGPTRPTLLSWTFNDLLRERLLHHHDNVAVISKHEGTVLTYGDLNRNAETLAASLHGMGVRSGDRIGVLLGNRVEYAVVSGKR
jgi:non-ribosomal peptide synthetase component E (peptide arylation enzyme)